MSSSIGDGSHGFGVGAGFPFEEAAEQVQSPDSAAREASSSVEAHSGAGVSDGQAQPPGRSARKPLRISTDLFTKPPRLWTDADIGKEDPYSPITPAEEVMSQYADPDNLPGPTGHSNNLGVQWTHFGSVEVPSAAAMHYLEVRRHMARAEPGKKYLVHLENRPDVETLVLPYVSADPRFPLRPIAGIITEEKKAVVFFPVDQASLTASGGRHSAATLAAHELAHAARMIPNPQTGMPEHAPDTPQPIWTNSEERHAIQKVENPVAKANGESGDRDSIDAAGFFFTGSVRSTTPVDPQQKSVIERFGPQLRALTAQMDLSILTPGDFHKRAPALRFNMAIDARGELDVLERWPAIVAMAQSGKSLDEIATELKLTDDQKEIVKNKLPPPPQPKTPKPLFTRRLRATNLK